MKTRPLITLAIVTLLFTGCAAVDITKTSKGYRAPTDPNEVQILKTYPQRPYEELGTVTASKFPASQEAKMHNALRAKAAPLGANAVVITSEGMLPSGFEPQRYCMGVAIAWKTE